MPWKETFTVDQRVEFIRALERDEESFTALCRRHGVSRKTGYKWLERFEEGLGLADQSRAPKHHGRAIDEATVSRLVELKKEYPSYGPKKLLVLLQQRFPQVQQPATSTVGEILKRAGLVVPRKPRRSVPLPDGPFASMTSPNAVWSADFKGHFWTRHDRRAVHPLTIVDGYSRFLLRCQSLSHTDFPSTKRVFESAFSEYGMPWVIRTDNGPPFASVAAGGLSQLSIWLLKLGICPERIQPGKPTQNGRHERLHRTLKAATAAPPANTWHEQQARFDTFRHEYNHVRPHEGLGQQTPAAAWRASSRPYTGKLSTPTYDDEMLVRRVRLSGEIRLNGHLVFIGATLVGEEVGIEHVDDDTYAVFYGPVCLGGIGRDAVLDRYWRPAEDNKVSPM